MAKRRKEEARQTRERILDAAITVFHERGVARPSLTDIAKLAGVTRGAIYGHFRNKADLFTALTDRVRLPNEMFCESTADGARRDPLGEWRRRWLFLFREVAVNRQWQLILEIIFHRCELVDESGEIRERLLEARANGIERMKQLLEAAVEAGQLSRELDVDTVVPMLHGSMLGILQDWLLVPDSYDLVRAGERHIDTMRDMMRLSGGSRH